MERLSENDLHSISSRSFVDVNDNVNSSSSTDRTTTTGDDIIPGLTDLNRNQVEHFSVVAENIDNAAHQNVNKEVPTDGPNTRRLRDRKQR